LSAEYVERWTTPVSQGSLWNEAKNWYSGNLLAPSWTLKPELIFSAALPFGILILNKKTQWFISLVMILIYIKGLPVGALSFILGSLIASYEKEIQIIFKTKTSVYLALAFCVCMYVFNPAKFIILDRWEIWAFTSAIVISVLISSQRLQSVADISIFKLLGKASFGIYLMHWPIMFFITGICCEYLKIDKPSSSSWICLATIISAATIAAGLIFNTVIERPVIKYGRVVASAIAFHKTL
jgi:peptidoglycan/LPS O-acetylase OafA/YrhL